MRCQGAGDGPRDPNPLEGGGPASLGSSGQLSTSTSCFQAQRRGESPQRQRLPWVKFKAARAPGCTGGRLARAGRLRLARWRQVGKSLQERCRASPDLTPAPSVAPGQAQARAPRGVPAPSLLLRPHGSPGGNALGLLGRVEEQVSREDARFARRIPRWGAPEGSPRAALAPRPPRGAPLPQCAGPAAPARMPWARERCRPPAAHVILLAAVGSQPPLAVLLGPLAAQRCTQEEACLQWQHLRVPLRTLQTYRRGQLLVW
ncbi:uncharacterized protein LOC144374668 isoform X3 [Ictidomys tridecemlineatus]